MRELRPVILNGKNNKPLTTSKNHIKTRAASDLSLALAIQISFFSLSLWRLLHTKLREGRVCGARVPPLFRKN